jgi:nicotinate-nucleotide pyrophosphorylase (carboxylating)
MHSLRDLIDRALQEDIGSGDITTDTLVDPLICGLGQIVAKERLVIAGLDVAAQVYRRLDPQVDFQTAHQDGDWIETGDIVVAVKGKLRALLSAERTALNFLQRLSGIATHVRSFVEATGGLPVRLVDTRKTTPGLRVLEKYAVRIGGAFNHRIGLFDGILIKDNHIAACGGISESIRRLRRAAHHLLKIEVEVSDLAGVAEAVDAGADVIMLDNMTLPQIEEAVQAIGGRALVEVSGRISADQLERLSKTGIDIISVGALTHSARSVDLSMRIQRCAEDG